VWQFELHSVIPMGKARIIFDFSAISGLKIGAIEHDLIY
jgi:hypothetical protein